MAFELYPSFGATIWSGTTRVPLHLPLLHISAGAGEAIEAITKACSMSPDPMAEIRSLLADVNWRPNLVGAVATLVHRYDGRIVEELWGAFDGGSWVSPQLAVVAACIDDGFVARATSRIEARCDGTEPRVNVLSPAEKHSAGGPEGDFGRRCKGLAALLWICRARQETSQWADERTAEPDIARMLASDIDHADGICQGWAVGLRPLLVEYGVRNTTLDLLAEQAR